MNKFEIIYALDEESFGVYLNGALVATANHDDHGWSGMDAINVIVENIAEHLGATLEHRTEAE